MTSLPATTAIPLSKFSGVRCLEVDEDSEVAADDEEIGVYTSTGGALIAEDVNGVDVVELGMESTGDDEAEALKAEANAEKDEDEIDDEGEEAEESGSGLFMCVTILLEDVTFSTFSAVAFSFELVVTAMTLLPNSCLLLLFITSTIASNLTKGTLGSVNDSAEIIRPPVDLRGCRINESTKPRAPVVVVGSEADSLKNLFSIFALLSSAILLLPPLMLTKSLVFLVCASTEVDAVIAVMTRMSFLLSTISTLSLIGYFCGIVVGEGSGIPTKLASETSLLASLIASSVCSRLPLELRLLV